jgi:hypothetical protein
MDLLFNILEIAGVGLQALLVVVLLPSSIRKYPLLFLYCATQLVTSVLEVLVSHSGGRGAGRQSSLFIRMYGIDEIVLASLLFLLVITLIYKALEGKPARATVGKILGGIIVVTAALPFILYYRRGLFTTAWFNPTAQLITFGAAIMSLFLWGALIANRGRERQLLLVIAGLGLAVTGAAVGFGLRTFTSQGGLPRELANLFKDATYVTSMLIWCWTFRPAARKPQTPPAAVASPSIQS